MSSLCKLYPLAIVRPASKVFGFHLFRSPVKMICLREEWLCHRTSRRLGRFWLIVTTFSMLLINDVLLFGGLKNLLIHYFIRIAENNKTEENAERNSRSEAGFASVARQTLQTLTTPCKRRAAQLPFFERAQRVTKW